MKLNIIYSETNDHVIGVNNQLYCHISDDLKNFKKITSTRSDDNKNILIMGYNTYLSLPRSLNDENREMIVISRKHYDDIRKLNIRVYRNLEECFGGLEKYDYHRIFIIGGSQIYGEIVEKYNDKIDLIYQTQIHENVNKDLILQDEFCLSPIMINNETHGLIKTKTFETPGKIYTKEGYDEKIVKYTFNIYQNKSFINKEENQYLTILKDILEENNYQEGRNGSVIKSFGQRMVFDLRNGFPLLTTKKMPWKTILRELIWFINGSTDNRRLQGKNVHIWDLNASKTFLESRGLDYEEGDLGPIYGFQWRHFGAEYVNHETDYDGLGVDQLQWIIDEIKTNPSSRRLIMSAWNPVDLDKMALPPCHLMIQFSIDGEYIDAQMYQRSGDMFLGVPFNISSYSFLLCIIGKLTGYIPRRFYHILGDSHIYSGHIKYVKEQLERIPFDFPKCEIIREIDDINDIHEEDFRIIGYKCEKRLSAPMVA
jgi:dihydrofolate reductase / thymidylate synthase